MKKNKNLIIADITSLRKNTQSFGHFFHVAEMYTQLFNNEYNVIVSGGPIYAPKFSNLKLLKYDIDLSEFNNSILKIKAKLKEVLNSREVLKNNSNSIIIFQDYSNISLFLSILLFKSKNSIYLIQYKNEIESGIKKILFKLIKKRVNGIICSKDSVGMAYKIPYLTVPDYICINPNKDNKKIEELVYDYGVFGIIRPGKDVVGVAKLFSKSNLKLIIAGSVQDKRMLEEIEIIAKESDNITFINEYLSDSRYDILINKTKCVILPYIDDYYNDSSSGVVFDVIFRNKPVIVKDYPIFSFVKDNNIGYIYQHLEELQLEQLIKKETYNEYKKNINKYLEMNHKNKKSLIRFFNYSEVKNGKRKN